MATLYKRGKCWYLNWRESGQQRRVSLGKITQKEAEAALRNKEIALDLPHGIAPAFRHYVNDYKRWYESHYPESYDRTEQIIRCHLEPRFGHFTLDRIPPVEVEQWKSERLMKVKAETVRKELRVLKAMINRAVDWGVIPASPIRLVKEPRQIDSKPPRFYTADEMRALYQQDPDGRFIWQLLANTGLRRGEALQLRKQWVLTDRLQVVSQEGERSKSGRWREVPLSPAGREAVEALCESQGGDYVLPRCNPDSLSRRFRKTAQRAGVGGNIHCLRHTFCSHLVMAGVPLRTVQVLAGHASFTTTEKYAHLSPDHLSGAVSGLRL